MHTQRDLNWNASLAPPRLQEPCSAASFARCETKDKRIWFLVWFEKLSDLEEYYLTYCLPSGVLHLSWQGERDHRRRNSLYLTEEKERGTRRYDILFIYFYHLSHYNTNSSPPLLPPRPSAFCVFSLVCAAMFLSAWFVNLEEPTWVHTQTQRREGRWKDNGAGVFSPIRFRDGDIPSLD